MDDVRQESAVHAKLLHCAGCGQVIGVYEPLVHIIAGVAHKTSRAADPHVGQSGAGACYHLACRGIGGADLTTAD